MRRSQLSSSAQPRSTTALRRVLPLFLYASATSCLTAAPTFFETLWPLGWIAYLPLWLALRAASPRQAFFIGWWTETLMYWVGFYWLIGTMVHFGFIAVPLSVVLFLIIGAGNGVRMGVFAWWLRRTAPAAPPWWAQLLLPACTYVALDYVVPRVFPWHLGFLHYPAWPLIQIADVTGIYGVTFVLIVSSTVGAAYVLPTPQSTRSARRAMGWSLIGLLLLQGGYGFWRSQQVATAMAQAPPLRVALLQPNIGMYEKRSGADRYAQLDLQISMSRTVLEQHPDLILWPESMYPFAIATQEARIPLPYMEDNRTAYWLLGALAYSGTQPTREVFNSAFLLTPEGTVLGRYDKQHLLAFGEYIPLQRFFPFLRNISPTIGNLTAGTGGIVTLPNGVGIGPLICYEDIVPELARHAVRQGAQLLVNLTNDVWFGPTRAPYQHRLLAGFRAVENRVYLVRVTNTGLTSIIDALGREQVALPIYQTDTLVHTIQPLRIPSVYTRWGDWFAQLCSALALLLPGYYWMRGRRWR